MNWADHCSSDDESDDGLHHPARLAASNHSPGIDNDLSYEKSKDDEEDSISESDLEIEEETIPYPPPIDMNNLPEDFPTKAPFTAHVNNVAFNIKNEEELGDKIERLVTFRYQGSKRVKVTGARFAFDRATGKRRGYAYVEFDTAEELMLFLNISDGRSTLHGRPITINIARTNNNMRRNNSNNSNGNNSHHNNNNRRSNGDMADIDGSKFRGGIRNNSNGNMNRSGSDRPSLKLAPRTKPREGKPSDGDNWRSGDRDGGRGGRGGGGGRGRGRGRQNGNGRGNPRRNSSRNDKKSGGGTDADGWGRAPSKSSAAPAAVPVKKVEEKKAVTKVQNAFNALAFDSDSD